MHSHSCCLLHPVPRLHLPLSKLYSLNVTPQAGTVLAGAPAALVLQPFPLASNGKPSQGTHWEAGQGLPRASPGCCATLPAWSGLIVPWKATLLPTACHQLLGRGVFSSQPWFPAQLRIRLKTLHFFSKCLLKVNDWSSRNKTKAQSVICFLHCLLSLFTVLSWERGEDWIISFTRTG